MWEVGDMKWSLCGLLTALCYWVNIQYKGSKFTEETMSHAVAKPEEIPPLRVYLSVLDLWFQRTWQSGPVWRVQRCAPSSATPRPLSSGSPHGEDPGAPSPARSDGVEREVVKAGQTYLHQQMKHSSVNTDHSTSVLCNTSKLQQMVVIVSRDRGHACACLCLQWH